ncbi:hypothetical protein H4Q26_012492 [Puccinia striiformis f. sp. tritici PST-130]|nr:hypothetical protein H4Q26_012492 [Puccinia striiformis f. sp. tritici PST-130]
MYTSLFLIPVSFYLEPMNVNLAFVPGVELTTLHARIVYYPILCNGDESPPRELASLGRESSINNRDGIMHFSSPPRMVDLSPVDRVSIDMPPCNDVSTYGTMIREHSSPYEIPPPEGRAMNTDSPGSPVSSDVATTRTRDGEEQGFVASVS